MLKHFSKRLIWGFLGLLFLILTAALVISPRTFVSRETIKSSPLFLSLRSVKLSLIKLPDIAHLPYWFKKTKLETYHLDISQNDILELNRRLPSDIYDGKLDEESKFFVPANFKAPGYEARVKVRYRGFGSNHWNTSQRSYLVRFPVDNLYKGMKSMALIIAYDRGYYAEHLADFRARKLGLKTPEFDFVRVDFNNQDNGVYLAVEQWSDKWTSKQGIQEDSNLYALTKSPEENPDISLLKTAGSTWWKDYTDQADFDPLKNLAGIVENADNEIFKRLIPAVLDMDKFYDWATINMLAGSFHQQENTIVLLFNRASGKFEMIPWDVNHYYINDAYFQDMDLLSRRVLSIPEFYGQFRQRVLSYLNEENINGDLAFYDKIFNDMKPEFYSDRIKFHNDFTFLRLAKRAREQMLHNFENIPGMLTENTPVVFNAPFDSAQGKPKTVSLTGSFSNLQSATASPTEFIRNNPQFRLSNSTLVLGSGSYYFSKDVIVPQGLTLIIEPGANLFFAKSISLVSYSPIIADGSSASPIRFMSADARNNWGVVAVSGGKARESIFNNVLFSKGSSSKQINGVVYTGMLSAHYSAIKVRSSTFIGDMDDDAFNVKYGSGVLASSYFTENNGDAADIDESPEFLVSSNQFVNNGHGLVPGHATKGDAIDASYNRSLIEKNSIVSCGDKGISIGEASKPKVVNNIIVGCDYGIAVKDSSEVYLEGNKILNNRVGLGLYQKKAEFGGGKLTAQNMVLWGNQIEFEKDGKSAYAIKDSTVEGGSEGVNISADKPDFTKILPASILSSVENLIH